MSKVTRTSYEGAMVKALQEFGYPSVTVEMVREITDAYKKGKRDGDLPHGIIGMFCDKYCEEATAAGIL